MNTSGSADEYKILVSQRDSLLRQLQEEGVQGILSVGLTRHEGRRALLVLVRPGFGGIVPGSFNGTTVIVKEIGPASAHKF